jgi:hypothetical protein
MNSADSNSTAPQEPIYRVFATLTVEHPKLLDFLRYRSERKATATAKAIECAARSESTATP